MRYVNAPNNPDWNPADNTLPTNAEILEQYEFAETQVGKDIRLLLKRLADARRTSEYWKGEHLAANAIIKRVTALPDYLEECSQSGFVTVTNPYKYCRNLLKAALGEQL